jgi:hypothetical protein
MVTVEGAVIDILAGKVAAEDEVHSRCRHGQVLETCGTICDAVVHRRCRHKHYLESGRADASLRCAIGVVAGIQIEE